MTIINILLYVLSDIFMYILQKGNYTQFVHIQLIFSLDYFCHFKQVKAFQTLLFFKAEMYSIIPLDKSDIQLFPLFH